MSRNFAATRTGGRAAPRSTDEVNVLGATVRVRGRLLGDGDLRVEGEIEGDVRVRGALEIGESGNVRGSVAAQSVTLSGTLAGDVEAEGAILIRAGARVAGDMSGSEVALEEGASYTGRIQAEFDLPDGLGDETRTEAKGRGAAGRGRR
jgi:cytoskeletal protein CcmA (bactofilin family)